MLSRRLHLCEKSLTAAKQRDSFVNLICGVRPAARKFVESAAASAATTPQAEQAHRESKSTACHLCRTTLGCIDLRACCWQHLSVCTAAVSRAGLLCIRMQDARCSGSTISLSVFPYSSGFCCVIPSSSRSVLRVQQEVRRDWPSVFCPCWPGKSERPPRKSMKH